MGDTAGCIDRTTGEPRRVQVGDKWLERRRDTILPAPYFHVVFTLPSELRPVVAMNRERLFGLLFEAASKTLLLLSRDKKRLGGMPAITMVLHTWTRELVFHPHVHAIVSAGALAEDDTWVRSREDYLFPVKVMARLFRRLFRHGLLKAIDAGEVNVPAEVVEPMRRALFEKKWVVYAKAPFGGAEQVYSYLGRYTHRVGISNARILRVDARGVTFATKMVVSARSIRSSSCAGFCSTSCPRAFTRFDTTDCVRATTSPSTGSRRRSRSPLPTARALAFPP